MATESTAASPATAPAAPNGDGKGNDQGPGNLTQGQAAAKLFASTMAAETKPPTPVQIAAEETVTEKSDEPTTPAAEASAASVDASDDDPLPPEPEEAATTTDSEPEADTVPSQVTSDDSEESLDAATKTKIHKKIGKEIAQRKSAEAQVELLRKELDAIKKGAAPIREQEVETTQAPAQPMQAMPLAPVPLAEFNDFQALAQYETQAKSAKRWAEQTLDNPKAWKTKIETDPDTGEETSTKVTYIGDQAYSEAVVRGIRQNSALKLEDEIPARAKFLNMRQHATQIAHQKFPFLADKKSPDYQRAQQMLRDPWVQMRPDAEYIVGIQIQGEKALQAAEAAAKAATETKPTKPKVVQARPSSDQAAAPANVGAARIPVQTGNRAALAADEQKLRTKGGITTAEAIASLKNRERFRNSR